MGGNMFHVSVLGQSADVKRKREGCRCNERAVCYDRCQINALTYYNAVKLSAVVTCSYKNSEPHSSLRGFHWCQSTTACK